MTNQWDVCFILMSYVVFQSHICGIKYGLIPMTRGDKNVVFHWNWANAEISAVVLAYALYVGDSDEDFFAGIAEVDNKCIWSCFKQLIEIFEKTHFVSGAFPSEAVEIVEDVKVVTHVIETVVIRFVNLVQSCMSGGHEASLVVMNPAIRGGVVVFVEVPAINS